MRTVVISMMLMLVPSLVRAQIVNMQSLLLKEAKDGLTLSWALKGEARDGNVEYLKAGAGGIVFLKHGRHNGVMTAKVDYASNAGTSFIKEVFGHARWRWWVWGRLGVEAFVQQGYKPISRIESRTLLGVGIPFTLVKNDTWIVSGALDMMLEKDRYSESDEYLDSGKEYDYLRLDTFVTVGWTPGKAKFFVTAYYQPVVDDFSNMRLLLDGSIMVPIASGVNVALTGSYSHDTVSPQGTEPFDLKITWALTGTVGPYFGGK